MSTGRSILFTGYAPVHFVCFEPLYRRLVEDSANHVFLSGGLRTKTPNGIEYDAQGMYSRFAIPSASILSIDEIACREFEILFAANTNLIEPRCALQRVQIFHGVSFRNKALRSENLGADRYFFVGPYMRRAFASAGLMSLDDPRGINTGFMKTDRLLDGSLDRGELLREHGFSGRLPVVLYAPTGQKHNSLETMGEAMIETLSAARICDLIIKPHDHPKNTDVNWVERLSRFESEHLRVSRHADVIPLLFLADLLITDASSVSSEYSLLNRPMIFLDVPKLLANSEKQAGTMLDLTTWGRRCGDIVQHADEIPLAVGYALANPHEHAAERQAMAKDLFYNPGCATDHAFQWLNAYSRRAAA